MRWQHSSLCTSLIRWYCGQVTIPTRLIFQPLPCPGNATVDLVLSFEDVRLAIIAELGLMLGSLTTACCGYGNCISHCS